MACKTVKCQEGMNQLHRGMCRRLARTFGMTLQAQSNCLAAKPYPNVDGQEAPLTPEDIALVMTPWEQYVVATRLVAGGTRACGAKCQAWANIEHVRRCRKAASWGSALGTGGTLAWLATCLAAKPYPNVDGQEAPLSVSDIFDVLTLQEAFEVVVRLAP